MSFPSSARRILLDAERSYVQNIVASLPSVERRINRCREWLNTNIPMHDRHGWTVLAWWEELSALSGPAAAQLRREFDPEMFAAVVDSAVTRKEAQLRKMVSIESRWIGWDWTIPGGYTPPYYSNGLLEKLVTISHRLSLLVALPLLSDAVKARLRAKGTQKFLGLQPSDVSAVLDDQKEREQQQQRQQQQQQREVQASNQEEERACAQGLQEERACAQRPASNINASSSFWVEPVPSPAKERRRSILGASRQRSPSPAPSPEIERGRGGPVEPDLEDVETISPLQPPSPSPPPPPPSQDSESPPPSPPHPSPSSSPPPQKKRRLLHTASNMNRVFERRRIADAAAVDAAETEEEKSAAQQQLDSTLATIAKFTAIVLPEHWN